MNFESSQFESDVLSKFVDSFPERSTRLLESQPPEDLLEIYQDLSPDQRQQLFRRLRPQVASHLLAHLPEVSFLEAFRENDPVRVAYLLSLQDPQLIEPKLQALSPEELKDLRELQSFPVGSAGSIMNMRVRTCRVDDSVEFVLEQARREQSQFRDIFVVDLEGVLKGYLPVQDLLLLEPSELVSEHMHKSPPSITALSPSSEVAELFENFSISALPVVHVDGKLLGGIQHKSLLEELNRQAISSMASMAGASPSETALSKPFPAVGKRLPWLMINLLTAFVASAVVGFFESTISQVTALAVLLPVVAGQSGNTGAQAMAVTMRGLALREVRVRQWMLLMFKELRVGFINGLCVALVTGLSVYFWSGSLALGVIMVIAMTFSMIIASLSGAAIPVILTSIGKDPAQSSSVILTTVTDVMGFLSFLGLATLGLAYLV